MSSTADVVVIGGGLVGLAVSHELAIDGMTVALVEKDDFAQHQSRLNWGFIRQQGRDRVELPLVKWASSLWPGLADRLGKETGWVQAGNLAVFTTPQQESSYRKWIEMAQDLGVNSRTVSRDEISQMIPGWSRLVLGGIFAQEDGQAEPSSVIEAYLHACRRQGVTLHPHTTALGILTDGAQVTGVKTNSGTIATRSVVMAAGAWSRQLLKRVGIDLPQTYVHNTVTLTTPATPVSDTTVWGPGFAFRQREDGRFVCSAGGNGTVDIGIDTLAQSKKFMGAFRNNVKKFRLRPERRIPHELAAVLQGKTLTEVGPPKPRSHHRDSIRALNRLQESIHGLDDLKVERTWSGVIDSTPDAQPIIDNDTGVVGLTIVTGFTGHGFGIVPAVSQLTAELVRDDRPSLDISSLRFGRFANQDFVIPDAII